MSAARNRANDRRESVLREALPIVVSVTAVLAGGGLALSFHDLGPQSIHMALHIALMNVAAPVGAAILTCDARLRDNVRPPLWAVAAVQVVLLWMWHAPPLQRMELHSLQAVMHGSLFVTALFFWRALMCLPAAARWQAIPVLLLTGKLVCLLSALIVFAPRTLYALPAPIEAPATHPHSALTALADQQLAGLLMMTTCLLSYVVSGVVFAAQAISGLPRESDVSQAGAGR